MADQQIQFRRDTAIRWAQVNPVLLDGEPGYELDTGFWKIGDGVRPWNSLAYKAEDGPQGPQGIQGIQGIQGQKGDKGDKGDTGSVGAVGPANSLSIGTVTPGSSPSDAAASISGSSPSQVLNLVLPKGEKGDKGDKGDTGQQGIQGPKGDAAGINLKGVASVWPPAQSPATNDLWLLGSPVPTGTPASYLAGDGILWTGSVWQNVGPIRGPIGPQGATGATGSKGDKGDTGPQGHQGAAGLPNVLTIGTVASVPAGTPPSATITGNSPSQTLSFSLPLPPANTLTIGTVTAGSTPSATITGTAPNQVLNLVLPNPQIGQATSFTSNPANASAYAGNNVTLSALAQSTETPIVYSWQVQTAGGSTWTNITGAGSHSYTFTPVIGDNGKKYRCVATTTSVGPVYSLIATLTVTAKPPADGSLWEPVSGGTSAPYLGDDRIPYGAGVFAAGSYYSDDGRNWTLAANGQSGKAVFGNGFFLSVPTAGLSFRTSTDGKNWSNSYASGLATTDKYNSVAFGGGKFLIAMTRGINPVYSYIAETADGVVFSTRAVTEMSLTGANIFYAGGVFVMRANDKYLYWSADGVAWTKTATLTTWTRCYHAHGANTHVLIGSGNTALTSVDGKIWVARTLPTSGDWRGLAFGNSMFMTAGYNSVTVLTSANGTAWTAKNTLPASNSWDNVNYGANLFVISSTNSNANKIVTSG